MTSSKKKRGKERKAKKQAAAAATTNPSGCMATEDILAFVRIGDNYTTNKLLEGCDIPDDIIHKSLDDILSVMLGFLQQCEDETFDQVMAEKSGRRVVSRQRCDLTRESLSYVASGVGGDLGSPSTWIKVLAKLASLRPSCMLQIVDNVGPLIRCMCNDTERLFFGSNEHWGDSILPFVRLISNILRDQPKIEKKDVIDAVFLQHEGFLRRIIQWGFWDEHRPDILREKLGQDDCMSITTLGRKMTQRLVSVAGIPRDDARSLGAANRVKFIASTPIVSHYYDPNCMTSYVVGLMRYMKTTGDVSCMFELETLIIDSLDCADKDIITEVIDLGLNCTMGANNSVIVMNMAGFILLEEVSIGQFLQNDTRIAFAIRSGLIEMCLSFVDRFGEQKIFTSTVPPPLCSRIENVLKSVYCVSLHKKTWKAIRHKRNIIGNELLNRLGQNTTITVDNIIEEELLRLEQNKPITVDANCKKLLDMVRCILDTNGAYCCWCNKSLGRRERKQCNGCHHMTYCSRACQKKDWLNGGHSISCGKLYTDECVGQYQGRTELKMTYMPESERDVAKLKELEINIIMVQQKLFHHYAKVIVDQASSLDIDLSDCVVRFDLRECPPSVTVVHYTKYFETSKERKGFEGSRSKANITCIYISDVYNGKSSDTDDPDLVMQRLFPHEWLTKNV